MADTPNKMQKAEKKKRKNGFCVSKVLCVMNFHVQFHLKHDFLSLHQHLHIDLQVPHPLGMALVGSARSADRLAPAMMPVTEGKYRPIMFKKLYLAMQRITVQDPRVKAQNSLRDMSLMYIYSMFHSISFTSYVDEKHKDEMETWFRSSKL